MKNTIIGQNETAEVRSPFEGQCFVESPDNGCNMEKQINPIYRVLCGLCALMIFLSTVFLSLIPAIDKKPVEKFNTYQSGSETDDYSENNGIALNIPTNEDKTDVTVEEEKAITVVESIEILSNSEVKTNNVKKTQPQETTNTAPSIPNNVPVESCATVIWDIMRGFGWSEVVCAGIIGNIMTECGGQTLEGINPNSNGCGYGLFQWTSARKSTLLCAYGQTPSIEQQMEYMYNELTGNGIKRQVTESQYQAIINSPTPEIAAKNFARFFERCGGNYQRRQRNARTAYNAFMIN